MCTVVRTLSRTSEVMPERYDIDIAQEKTFLTVYNYNIAVMIVMFSADPAML